MDQIFVHGSGAFFVNYIVQLLFLRAALRIWSIGYRLQELYLRPRALTAFEIAMSRMPIEFNYGFEYAYLLMCVDRGTRASLARAAPARSLATSAGLR